MMKSTYIHRIMRRGTLFLLAALLSVHTAMGQGWNGIAKAPLLSGSGTEEDPYLIKTAEDLKYLQENPALWGDGIFILQTDNIDLNNQALGMIGYGLQGSQPTNANHGVHHAFKATYDGGGNTISNLLVDWSEMDASPRERTSFGLFGLLTGTVRNLVIDNARVTRTSDGEVNVDGLKVSVLCGAAAPGATIENIIINNSRIDDGGFNPTLYAAYFGGVVGDITCGFFGTAPITQTLGYVTIRNVYANVDVNITAASRPTSMFQYNIGGIVGRLRRGKYADLPDNTYYTGTIHAPWAMIGPVYGSSRADGGTGVSDVFRMYVGQVLGDENTTSTAPSNNINLDVETTLPDGTTVNTNANRLYKDFFIYDSNTRVDVDVTTLSESELTATNTPKIKRRVRTLGGSLPSGLAQASDMRHFQGVNRGREAASLDEAITMFNQYATTHSSLNTWVEVGGKPAFSNRTYLFLDRVGRRTFHADMQPSEAGFHFRWEGRSANTGSWVEITDGANVSGASTSTLVCHNTNDYSEIRVIATKGEETLRAATLVLHPTLDLTYDRATGSYKAIAGNLFDGEEYEYRWSYYDSEQATWISDDEGMNNTVPTTGTSSFNTFAHPATAWIVAVELYFDGQPITDLDGNHLRQVFTNYRLELSRVTTHSEDKSGFRYVASVYSHDGSLVRGGDENIQGEHTTWLWEVTSDPTNRFSWEQTDLWDRGLQKQNFIAPYSPERYYRVTWVVDGQPVLEQVMGPINVIFLYDRDKTTVGFNKGYTKFDGYDNARGLKYDDGDDNNTGYGPYHAVKTMKRAYELVDPSRGVHGNIIVVMGYYYDTEFLYTPGDYAKPVTITGNRGSLIYDGGLNMATDDSDNTMGLQGSTTFRLINFVGDHTLNSRLDESANNMLFLYCNLNDLMFDEGVVMRNYSGYGGVNGLYMKDGKNANAPFITIVGGIHNRNVTTPLVYPPFNETEGVTTITFHSGCFGRIIAGARNNAHNPGSHNVFGTPENPHRVRVNVAISHAEGQNQIEYADKDYDFDINLMVGGQTDGTVYSEAEINVYDGSIGRYISGNISYGRSVGDTTPDDSYFGSTMLTLQGGSIEELYGGTLGRHSGNSTVSAPYFYGRSIINIDGGRVNGNIYGAGSGGVMGIGFCPHGNEESEKYDMHHTSDLFIPYYDSAHNLKYGDFATVYAGSQKDENGVPLFDNVPTMDLVLSQSATLSRDGDDSRLHLGHSYSEVNVWSGTVNGNIYGGGYGYSSEVTVDKALGQAGYVFGETYVNMEPRRAVPPTVNGTIYGGGNGSANYYHEYVDLLLLQDKQKYAEDNNKAAFDVEYDRAYAENIAAGKTAAQATTAAQKARNTMRDEWIAANYPSDRETAKRVECEAFSAKKFGKVADLFGNTHVTLKGGYVDGDVFAGSVGDAGLPDMAAIYGSSNILIDGVTVNGHIYGGSDFASIRFSDHDHDHENSGNTYVTVRSGVVGDCVFGGSRGSDGSEGLVESMTNIDGDTHVNIEGGDFINTPYINKVDKTDGYRAFNIYGGGNKKCVVHGTARLNVSSSLIRYEESFIPNSENPNADPDPNVSIFQGAYMDITYCRFNLYGGGYGEKTNCLNTDVYVTIPSDCPGGANAPHGYTLKKFYDHQSFFDIAGGGYSGDVGYWAKKVGDKYVPVDSLTGPVSVDDYEEYIGGNCHVVVDGYTYCRKLIGGGFYGSCRNADTHFKCGSLHQVYGGSLLGYVHDQAKVTIGNRIEDFLKNDGTDTKADSTLAATKAKDLNKYIFITENVYGGNDVKGIVGTTKWTSLNGYHGIEATDGAPMFMTDVSDSEDKGVVFNIYGGVFMGDVYGAGNGHYRGYYVPEWVRYEDGPARMYRKVITSKRQDGDALHVKKSDGVTDSLDVNGHFMYVKGNVYRSRPMVGSVNINIRGNSANDSIVILGNFYGGGRDCTIGQWRTILPFEDPRRLTTGGHLHINIGGHLHVQGNMYMGVHGGLYAEQELLKASEHVDLNTFDGSTTEQLLRLGEAAYDHWYFNKTTKRYEPGFPAPGEVDGNFSMTGEHMFRGYMKNIEMPGDVELTFYRDLYRDPTTGVTDSTKRRRWVPGEIAYDLYDADHITMNSFFLGGKCGSMTNNNVMRYCYTTGMGYDMYSDNINDTHKHEQFGSIYRVTMGKGVTIKNLLVMGAEDALTTIYPYNSDFTAVVKKKGDGTSAAHYRFEGGMVTQATYSFDYIAYNDYMQRKATAADPDSVWNTVIKLPDGFYDGDDNPGTSDNEYKVIWNVDQYTLIDGTVIHRKYYEADNEGFVNTHFGDEEGGMDISHRRYALAVTKDGDKEYAYIGKREHRKPDGRDNLTVSKLTVACNFDPQEGEGESDPDHPRDRYDLLYGGVIYGGCYNSGVVTGDVILNVGSNMLGGRVKSDEYDRWFKDLSGLENYLGRVYGGGFGEDSRNDGDTYINLLRNVQAMNVFGGGMMGKVNGYSHINYIGNDHSFIYGSIYGGGFRGSVGIGYYENTAGERLDDISHLTLEEQEDYRLVVPEHATEVKLISGNVARVYGGSCMGDLYGQARVEMCDEVIEDLDHLDYSRFVETSTVEDWSNARLIVGSVFGGNDISGNIYHSDGSDVEDTYVLLHEEQYVDGEAVHGPQQAPKDAPDKDTPGSVDGFNGFPLVGNLYGGSNGNYGIHGADTKYAVGSVVSLATGNKNEVAMIDLGKPTGDVSSAMLVPHIDRTHVKINGGTVINAYGGGDMSTVHERTTIEVDYKLGNFDARAGFNDPHDLERIWNVCHLSNDQQLEEVTIDTVSVVGSDTIQAKIFKHQIFRIFGGNDHADMSIQPDWRLNQGNFGSIYSGANFGRMTHYNPTADTSNGEGKGITLVIDAPKLHANAVYGGGRVGDVVPDVPMPLNGTDPTQDPDLFGSTLIIRDGVVDHVYGGNDVSGQVQYGSKVEIYGSISGDVYCAGNGSYLYKYDPSLPYETNIKEEYDDAYGGRYFVLPYKPGYGDNSSEDAINSMHHATRLMAINSYRPNVERCHLKISGRQRVKTDDNGDPVKDDLGNDVTETVRAFVYGSIFMGGNSATVFAGEQNGVLDNVEFEIGDDVVINRIYMGSNGEQMINPTMMQRTERINNIDLSKKNLLDEADRARLLAVYPHPNDLHCFDKALYPNLLDIYMRAVDVDDMPKNFSLNKNHENAFIGDFFLGGNCGSMTTRRTIELSFPHNITVFGKIVGGSNNANVNYKGMTHYGGLTRKLDKVWDEVKQDSVQLTDKVWIKVHSKFRPMRLVYPDGNWWNAKLVDDIQDTDGNLVVRDVDDGKTYYVDSEGNRTEYTGKTYLTRGRCNVYGGCYNSGTTRGNIKLDVYSDMLLYGRDGVGTNEDITNLGAEKALRALRNRLQTVVNGINDKQWRTFAIVGGGFGSNTIVYGNIDIRMLPDTGDDHEMHGSGDETPLDTNKPLLQHPSCGAVFGGSQEGLVIGNTTIEMRDGTVLANMYGASEANYLYGSTEIIVGYPKHYTCKTNGQYFLDRADKFSRQRDALNYDDSEVVKHSVWYRAGDKVPNNVYEQIKEYDRLHAGDEGYEAQATEANFTICRFESPEYYGVKWDDLFISVGDPASRMARTPEDIASTPYYGHGNIYGGGFISTGAHMSLAGQKTLKRFTSEYMPEALAGVENNTMFGGNSSIMIWDNPANADLTIDLATGKDARGNSLRDHVTIGTARFMPTTLTDGDNKMGYYFYDPNETDGRRFQHQPMGEYDSKKDKDKLFFYVEADGGIYGGGRKVYCEGFRACDLAYYGYADYTPQMPKLINSFQRLDLLNVTDCCLQLQGSNDFATNFAANTVDATKYSMTRVGELRMNSSIDVTKNIDKGVPDGVNIGNTLHTKPRSRNFLAFFHSLKYLGALYSNVAFDDARFHDENGRVVADSSYFAKKDGIRDTFYNHSDRGNKALTRFKQRNVGTSPNMIGINNGYQLKVQGVRLTNNADNNLEIDNIYYGPAIGVMEVKLLTMAIGEGGGYVYALNHHEVSEGTTPSFMQTLGNFVFPGAAFGAATNTDAATMNYIIDDCFPVGMGYDYYMDPDKYHEHTGNVNEDQEIHYWYVNGQRYFFNATLTALTANYEGEGDTQRFHLDNSDNLIMLAGLTAESENMRVKTIKWTDEMGRENAYDLTRRDSLPDGTLGAIIPGYNLYITVDRNSNNELTPASSASEKNGAWVAEMTRERRFNQVVETVGGHDVYRTDPVVNLGAANGKFGNKTVVDGSGTRTVVNTPRLGVMLVDTRDNNDQKYFDDHLSKPATVQIVIAVDNPGDNSNVTLPYEYTLNLNIVYLKGTNIHGHIVIENCALPGEVIYANAYDVVNEGDDNNMGVTGRRWVLYKTIEKNDNGAINIEKMVDVDITKACIIDPAKETRIAIPAYLWMNGWHLGYDVTMNGQTTRVLTDATSQHPTLDVHNYHRMYSWDYTTYNDDAMQHPAFNDLQIVSGARVYLENETDLKYFFDYMHNKVQQPIFDAVADTLLQAHRGHIGKLYLPHDYDRYVQVDPQYAADVHFVLTTDIAINPTAMISDPFDDNDVDPGMGVLANFANTYKFAGLFSGNGHTIDMNNCTMFMGENTMVRDENGDPKVWGRIYNLGFHSMQPDVTVIGENHGRMLACFYYNDGLGTHAAEMGENPLEHRGQLIPQANLTDDDCDLQYCYQNANKGKLDHYGNSIYYADDQFHYGRVAYDLNVLYLNERYKRATSNEENQNPLNKSYVYTYYGDGEYRFGDYDVKGVGTATALRTDVYPNYGDHHGKGLIPPEVQGTATGAIAAAYGRAASHHNWHHLVDESREMYEGVYLPNYPKDFLFFGQKLDSEEEYRQKYPGVLKADRSNRVYRASGFYGTQEDRGFHFNRDCVVRNPEITAVDFTGERTREREAWYKKYFGNVPDSATYELGFFEWPIYVRDASGNPIPDGAGDYVRVEAGHHKQSVFYPPVLDLPTEDINTPTDDATKMYLDKFTVVGNRTVDKRDRVTKNLLVYAGVDSPMFDCLRYTEDMSGTNPWSAGTHPVVPPADGETEDENGGGGGTPALAPEAAPNQLHSYALSIQSDDQNKLIGHLLLRKDSHYETELFHLVDSQNYHAPIDFQVTKRAWYYRLPQTFSNGNSAWEGICLPFTATRVLATDYSGKDTPNPARSHGEVSHFYGMERADTLGDNIRHEYWLRSMTGTHHEGEKLVLDFTRPLYAERDMYGVETRVPYRQMTTDAFGNVYVTDTVPLKKATYHYSNTWFQSAYGGDESDGHYYQSLHTIQQYTEQGRDFVDYPFLTEAVPYIVSFPGKRYYEYSMSGEFYRDRHIKENANVYPQIITYEYTVGNETTPMNGTLSISATESRPPYNVLGFNNEDMYQLRGAFAYQSIDDATQYVVDLEDEAEEGKNRGTYFAPADEVVPFRVYLTVPSGMTIAHSRAYIGTRAAGGDQLPIEPDPEEQTIDQSLSGIRVYVVDGKLHIDSPVDGIMPLHTISGYLFRRLRVHEGTTVYEDLPRGCYVVHRKKVLLR